MTPSTLCITELTPETVSQTYLSWMNDPDVNKFLESRFTLHSIESLKEYVNAMHQSRDNILFGIYLLNEKKHIGNIKLGKINPAHRIAEVGIVIGDKTEWGKGYATEAIKHVIRYASDTLLLHSLYAEMYAHNLGSFYAFKKAGFEHRGTLKHYYRYEESFVDSLIMQYLAQE